MILSTILSRDSVGGKNGFCIGPGLPTIRYAASMLDAASFSILVFMLAQLLCVVVSGIAVIRLSTNIHALGVHFRFVLSGIVCWSCFGKIAQLLLVLVVLFLLANIIILMYSLFSFVWYSQLLYKLN